MKRKVFTAFVLFLVFSLLLCGCAEEQPALPETTADEETAEAEPASVISAADLPSYYIIRSEDAGTDLREEVSEFLTEMREKFNGISIQTDFYVPGVAACAIHELEIIIGSTEREESGTFIKGLKSDDYGYCVIGKKIVIAGGNDDATRKAIKLFRKNVLNGYVSGSEVFYSSENDTVIRGKYNVSSLYVSLLGNEIPIEEFRIIYSTNNKRSSQPAAESLKNSIEQETGFVLEVLSDKEAAETFAHEIRVGSTNRDDTVGELKEDEYTVTYNDSHISIYGVGTLELMAGTSDISMRFSDKKEEKLVIIPDNCTVSIARDYLTAMSFNNLVSSVTDERQSAVIGMIRKYMPDTLGMQESSPSWMTYLRSNLSDVYSYVGTGRDGGNSGEYNPIFYNSSKFKLLDYGTKWLSDTPDVVSKYEESSLNRIYTYALLQRKSDSKKILVVNTHFDHKSAEARTKQAKVLAAFLKSNAQYPIVLTGDFNTTSDTQAYKEVLAGGVSDSKTVAGTVSGGATFTSFGNANKIIDFIFVNSTHAAVNSYRVCSENINNVTPSDHHPVYIEYLIY